MNVLVLQPSHSELLYSVIDAKGKTERKTHRIKSAGRAALDEMARELNATGLKIDLVAVKGKYGGREFKDPETVTPEVLARLEKLSHEAPLHVPELIEFLKQTMVTFAGKPVTLVFETSFFVELPRREYLYAIDPGLSESLGVRRFGYLGLHHEAACAAVRQDRRTGDSQPRILSICLEGQPEIAAVRGRRPLMVTRGATPLEGLPGETACGEIDPSIVLILAEKLSYGPEQINKVLSRESGLLGLVGKRTNLKEVFTSSSPEFRLPREMFQHRILSACGAGMAALGGVDEIVFSGKYAELGKILGPMLVQKLTFRGGPAHEMKWSIFQKDLVHIVAEVAINAALQSGAVGEKAA